MKTKELIALLQEADPTGEVEDIMYFNGEFCCCIIN